MRSITYNRVEIALEPDFGALKLRLAVHGLRIDVARPMQVVASADPRPSRPSSSSSRRLRQHDAAHPGSDAAPRTSTSTWTSCLASSRSSSTGRCGSWPRIC
ncbi:MAG: hypothetical protein R3F43_15985 [bacterium]